MTSTGGRLATAAGVDDQLSVPRDARRSADEVEPLLSRTHYVYERFTGRALKILQLANQEAQRLGHERIGTEPILLGLAREGSGAAARVLKDLHVDLRDVRPAVEELTFVGKGKPKGKLPLDTGAKRAIEYAMAAARQMNHGYIGSEHILLGLLHEQDGVAACALDLGVTLKMAMAEIAKLSGR